MNYNMYLKWLTYLVIVLSQFQRYIQYLHGEEKKKDCMEAWSTSFAGASRREP